MNMVYLICNISKQGHHQAVLRLRDQYQKQGLYIRAMEEVREIHPGMGLRTMYDMLQPEGIGRDNFIALGLREGFRLQNKEKETRTTYSIKCHQYANLLVGRRFTDVNQLWSSDITYFHCEGKFYYIFLVMDVYSRRIVGYSLADNMRAENNVAALNMALTLRGIANYDQQLIHHSDKGSQYASDAYTQALQAYGIRISMCEEVYENTHIERINGTIKNQYLERMSIKSYNDLKNKLSQVINTYNNLRPHQSLNKMTPFAYEQSLKYTSKEKRKQMEIYTAIKDTDYINPNQLLMNFLNTKEINTF
jgi:transposase InsO family protein